MVAATKDRNKDGYFNRNFSQLPPAIQDQFKDAKQSKKRDLVNQIIVKGEDGRWQINLSAPIVAEWQEKYLDISKERGIITKPAGRAAAMWGGGWKELEEAVKRNEVWIVRNPGEDNTTFYQWKEFNEMEREGHRGGLKTSGERKLDIKQYNLINAELAKFDWNLNLSPQEMKMLTQHSETASLPDKVIANLDKVQKACDKAVNDAKLVWRRLQDLKNADATTTALAKSLQDAFQAPLLGLKGVRSHLLPEHAGGRHRPRTWSWIR